MGSESVYPIVRLGDVLRLDVDAVPVDSSKSYHIAGVYSFGRGLFGRGPLSGSETTYKKFNRLRENHIVLSQLKGWEGAIARVTSNFDGWFLSPQFPTFSVNEEQADVGYISWFCNQSHVWNKLRSSARGMGARRDTVPPARFLDLRVPLPSLDEQRRIVAKIDSLATKIDEVKQLRDAVQGDMNALLVAMAHRNDLSDEEKVSQGWQRVTLGEVLRQVSTPVDVEPGEEYSHFGIYSFAKGLFKKAPLLGDEIKAKKLYRVHEGQFIYSRLKAFEGAFGAVSQEFSGGHVSNEFPTFELDENRVSLAFLVAYTLSPQTWKSFAVHSKGVGARRERLKPENFLAERVWLPPMVWQYQIKSTMEKLASSREHQKSVKVELDALLPAILDRAFQGEL